MKSFKIGPVSAFFLAFLTFIVLLLIAAYSGFPFLAIIFIIFFIYIMFGHIKKFFAKVAGPETGLWLYTGSIGVSFAYLSIALFRQDKKFSKIEFEKLCNYFLKEYGQEVGEITKAFVLKYKRVKVNLYYQTREVAELSHKNRLIFLYNLFSMALANGVLKIEEERFLKRVADLIIIDDTYFDFIKSKFVKKKASSEYHAGQSKTENKQSEKGSFAQKFFSPSISAYLSLELEKNATNEEVKKAYRRLVMKYHPDRLNGKSETHKKIANQRFREITEAYELIKKERGIK